MDKYEELAEKDIEKPHGPRCPMCRIDLDETKWREKEITWRWQCRGCNKDNRINNSYCQKVGCYLPRNAPDDKKMDRHWRCTNCPDEVLNHPDSKVCSKCENSKIPTTQQMPQQVMELAIQRLETLLMLSLLTRSQRSVSRPSVYMRRRCPCPSCAGRPHEFKIEFNHPPLHDYHECDDMPGLEPILQHDQKEHDQKEPDQKEPEQKEPEQKDIVCNRCTFRNNPGSNRCKICDNFLDRHVERHMYDDWECQQCTYINRNNPDVCGVCGFHKILLRGGYVRLALLKTMEIVNVVKYV